MSYQCCLSTNDNPFNPFEQFIPWFMFDVEKGYNSCGLLMRFAKISDDMSQVEIDKEIERAIDLIVKRDSADIYIKVTKELVTEQ